MAAILWDNVALVTAFPKPINFLFFPFIYILPEALTSIIVRYTLYTLGSEMKERKKAKIINQYTPDQGNHMKN